MRFLLAPTAWILGAIAAGATACIARDTAQDLSVAGGIGVLTYLLGLRGLVAQRRADGLDEEIVGCRETARDARLLVDGLPAMVWRSDTTPTRVDTSATWLAVTGMTREAFDDGRWLDAIHPDDRERCLACLRLGAVDGEPFELEYRLLRADGRTAWVADRATPHFDDDGTFAGFMGLTLDLSKWRDVDLGPGSPNLRLLEACQTINRRVIQLADLYEDLEESKLRLAFGDRLRCEYLAALSDELRGPIDDLEQVTELLRATDLNELQTGCVERARGASSRLSALRERTIGLDRLEKDEENLEPGHFNLRRLIDQIHERQVELAEERDITANCVMQDVVPALVKADPLRIRRILIDAWSTAFGVSPDGRVILRVTCERKPETNALIRFTWTCTGAEVPDEQLDRAFYPIESLHGETPGLGLGPCRDTARAMGGDLGIQRSEDDGAVMIWATLRVEEIDPNFDGRRAHGRLAQESVNCSLGQVLDLSMGGLRTRCSLAPEGVIDLELSDEEETINLRAEVAWTQRVGFAKHEAGLRFVDVDPETNALLGRLAARNRLKTFVSA